MSLRGLASEVSVPFMLFSLTPVGSVTPHETLGRMMAYGGVPQSAGFYIRTA
jgi:hypothetical protein